MSHEHHRATGHADHKGHSAPQAPSGDASPAVPAAHVEHGDGLRTERIPLADLYCACCAEEIARRRSSRRARGESVPEIARRFNVSERQIRYDWHEYLRRRRAAEIAYSVSTSFLSTKR